MLSGGSALPAFLPPIKTEAANPDLRCRAAVASILIAGPELARIGALRLDQGDA